MKLRIRLFKFRVALSIAVLIAVLASNSYILGKFPDRSSSVEFFQDTRIPVVLTTRLVGDASEVFRKVNYERRLRKLKPLYWNNRLAELAAAYSEQMADEDFFSHYDPGGRTIVDRADDFDITDWTKIGENLFQGKGFVDISSVAVDGWMKSRTHKKNILDVEWTYTGVGAFTTSDGRTFITQAFMTK